jgi:putative hemolysin
MAALPAEQILHVAGDQVIARFTQQKAPRLLLEIGRLREIAFRAVGEGTGREVDLDDYDMAYEHLVAWDRVEQQVLGSYRFLAVDPGHSDFDLHSLYTSSLFDFDDGLLQQLGPCVELGRSFVRVECQRSSRVLAMLWRGIGTVVARSPRHRTLFGPVSISARYSEPSRQLLAAALMRKPYKHRFAHLVTALRPPLGHLIDALPEEPSLSELSGLVSRLEPDAKGLPPLVREYAKLCGRFLSFSIDPEFGSALDGLVAVDLRETSPRLLSLYMGQEAHDHCRRAWVTED